MITFSFSPTIVDSGIRPWEFDEVMADSRDQDGRTPEWADTDTDMTEDTDDVEFEVRLGWEANAAHGWAIRR